MQLVFNKDWHCSWPLTQYGSFEGKENCVCKPWKELGTETWWTRLFHRWLQLPKLSFFLIFAISFNKVLLVGCHPVWLVIDPCHQSSNWKHFSKKKLLLKLIQKQDNNTTINWPIRQKNGNSLSQLKSYFVIFVCAEKQKLVLPFSL